ncbi:MAG: nickel transporter [bacterium]
MTAAFGIAWIGLIGGVVHALSGPDHLMAIAPLAVDSPRRPWASGLVWGLGHTAGIFVMGSLALWLRDLLPLEWLSSFGERLVGLALIGIGLWGIHRALSRSLHTHEHIHEGTQHTHFHLHDPRYNHRAGRAHGHTHLSFAIGLLHSMAGSATILGVLPALAMPSLSFSIGYLACFGIGSTAAMAGFSTMVGWSAGLARRSALPISGMSAYRMLLSGSSCAAIAMGVFWVAWPSI